MSRYQYLYLVHSPSGMGVALAARRSLRWEAPGDGARSALRELFQAIPGEPEKLELVQGERNIGISGSFVRWFHEVEERYQREAAEEAAQAAESGSPEPGDSRATAEEIERLSAALVEEERLRHERQRERLAAGVEARELADAWGNWLEDRGTEERLSRAIQSVLQRYALR